MIKCSIKSYKNLEKKDARNIRIKGNSEILYIYKYVIQLLLLYYLRLYPANIWIGMEYIIFFTHGIQYETLEIRVNIEYSSGSVESLLLLKTPICYIR